MAEKLSGLPETTGKEESHRHGPLPLRQVRLEGLTLPNRQTINPRRSLRKSALSMHFDFILESARWDEDRGRLERS